MSYLRSPPLQTNERVQFLDLVVWVFDIFDTLALQVSLSPAELEELETVESWVNLMADLEESEADHCIALALR